MPDSSFNLAINSTAIIAIGGRQLLLAHAFDKSSGNTDVDAEADSDVYQVSLLPGPTPLQLTALLNRFLTAAFDLQLPQFVPNFSINSVSGEIVHVSPAPPPEPSVSQYVLTSTEPPPPPPPPKNSYYSLAVGSNQLVAAPFGSTVPIGLGKFSFSLNSEQGTPPDVLMNAEIQLGSGSGLKSVADGRVFLTSAGGSVVAINITEPVALAELVSTLMGLGDPDPDVSQFLPTLSPATSAGMRFYQASEQVTAIEGGTSVTYLKGFNVDDVIVSLLDARLFAITLQVDNGFVVSASLPELDLGIVVLDNNLAVPPLAGVDLGGPLINISDQKASPGETSSDSILLASTLTFFPDADPPLAFPLVATYTSVSGDSGGSSATFTGTIDINQNILGVQIQSLSIAWNKTEGFHIENFPIPFSYLSDFMDFAKLIREVANKFKSPKCGDLPSFQIKDAVQTAFTPHLSPTMTDGEPGLKITGTCTVYVGGRVATSFPLPTIIFTIDPSDFKSFSDIGTAMVQQIETNAEQLMTALYNQPKEFAELVGALTLDAASQYLLKKLQTELVCRFGDVIKDAIEDAIEAALKSLSSVLRTLLDAAVVFAAAAAVISFINNIIDCLKGSKKSKANKDKSDAQAKQSAARAKISSYLDIASMSAAYQITPSQIAISVSWSQMPLPQPPDSNATVLISAAGQSARAAGTATSYLIDIPASNVGSTVTVNTQGQYSHDHNIFTGNSVAASVAIPEVAIVQPSVSYDSASNQIPVTWSPTKPVLLASGGVAQVKSYQVDLVNQTTNKPVPGMQTTIPAGQPLSHAFDLVPSTAPLFWPEPADTYVVQITPVSNYPVLDVPWTSEPFSVKGGVGHTLVGLTFKVGGSASNESKDIS